MHKTFLEAGGFTKHGKYYQKQIQGTSLMLTQLESDNIIRLHQMGTIPCRPIYLHGVTCLTDIEVLESLITGKKLK